MIQKFTLKTCLAVLLFLSFGLFQKSFAQPDGGALFKANCAQCHSTGEAKVIGPGLKDIHKRRTEAWIIPWVHNSQAVIKSGDPYAVKLFEENNHTVMTPFPSLKDEEIKAILAYVKSEGDKAPAVATTAAGAAGTEGAAEDTGFPWLLFIVVVILFIVYIVLNRAKKGLERVVRQREGIPEPVALTGAAGRKHWIREHKKLIALLLVVGMAWSSYEGWYALAGIGIAQDYQPDQPIKFSHALHAGQNGINCQYCHSGASKSKTAGIPSTNVCMNCHKYVQSGPKYGTDEIDKIYHAIGWDKSKGVYTGKTDPIQWVRIHNLPDFAYFNHSQHVTVGKIECQTCHGPVEEMETVKQFSPLTMGWCINCHRETEVKMDGNGYYTKLHEQLKEKYGKDAKITVDKIGGLECARCHY
jgi:mono/diheme cytochrome c family protein